MVDGIWETGPAALIGDDPTNIDRVLVLYFPSSPSSPVTAVPSVVVSAYAAVNPPTDGEYIYVPNAE